MRAKALITAELDARGHTRLSVLKGEPPLLPRRTGPAGPLAQVHLVGGAAGPLGGDHLDLDIEVGAGAALRIHTVAATLVLPGRTGEPSRSTVRVRVAAGGRLDWLPEPLIAVRGCRHVTAATVHLDDGAYLRWREELIWGRYGEDGGDLQSSTAVTQAGAPVLRQELRIGPWASEWSGPAGLGGARATGSLLVVDPTATPKPASCAAREDVVVAWMPLSRTAALTQVLAQRADLLREALAVP